MNLNIQGILTGSLKILNIVNKTIPLVKEFNPSIKTILNKAKKINLNNSSKNKTNNLQVIDSSYQQKKKNSIQSLTFFK